MSGKGNRLANCGQSEKLKVEIKNITANNQ